MAGVIISSFCFAISGATPLHLAASEGQKAIVEYFLQNPAVDKEGELPIHAAACSGQVDVMKCLLKNGENVNATRDDGNDNVS